MKTDLYTKIVLTVIAACLLVLAFRPVSESGLVGRAYAAEAPAPAPPLDVRIVGVASNFSGLPVLQAKEHQWPVYLTPIGNATEVAPIPVYAARPLPTFTQYPQP